ncbi:hypothetical protein [uncultured Vagococcus sp.]|nr:hypothetical protein [uncultured Vagococcus sp.]
MKKVEAVMYKCGYFVGRLFIYYPKALKSGLQREKSLNQKKV